MIVLISSWQIGKAVKMDRDPYAKRSRYSRISGKPRIKIGNFTFGIWQTKSGKSHKKPQKWLIRQNG